MIRKLPFNLKQTTHEWHTKTYFICSCDLDLDLMTLIYHLT